MPLVNHTRLHREGEMKRETAASEFLNRCDALRVSGARLQSVIRRIGEHGEAAFRMTDRLPRAEAAGITRPITLRAGESSLDVSVDERGDWNRLLDVSARTITEMNAAVAEYEAFLMALLASGRKLAECAGVSLESVIGNAVDHSIAFRKAVDSYQNLRSGNPLSAAEARFNRLRIAAAGMAMVTLSRSSGSVIRRAAPSGRIGRVSGETSKIPARTPLLVRQASRSKRNPGPNVMIGAAAA